MCCRIVGIQSMKKYAYPIVGLTKVLVPTEDGFKEGTFDPTVDLEEVHNCYRRVDGTIAFIDGDTMYALPACDKVIKVLKKNGFVEDRFMRVPFTFGSMPVEKKEIWYELLKWQIRRLTIEASDKRRSLINAVRLARVQ